MTRVASRSRRHEAGASSRLNAQGPRTMSRARPWRSRPTSRSSPTGCTRSSLASETRSRVSCTATCPSSAPSCASTATTRTSTSSSTASAKPPRSSGSSPTRPRHPLMATEPGCPGGGERIGGTRRRGVLVCGRRFSCRVPHCRGLPALWRGGLGCVLGVESCASAGN